MHNARCPCGGDSIYVRARARAHLSIGHISTTTNIQTPKAEDNLRGESLFGRNMAMPTAGLQANAPPWASMPFPQGWEAKYEPNIGRYFFINHTTRKTQWVDPRKAIYDAQQRSPAAPRQQPIPMQPITAPKCRVCHRKDVSKAGGTCQACILEQQQREIKLMRAREELEEERKKQEQQEKLGKERERRRVQSAKRREERGGTGSGNEETAFSSAPPIDKAAVTREVKEMFSKTQGAVVEMILETCEWNKEKAVALLLSMGERKVVKAKAAAKQTPAAPKMSENQKQQMKARLQKKFPHASELMINMALDTTKYNEERAKGVLEMLKDDSGKTTTTTRVEVTFPESRPTSSGPTSSSVSGSGPSMTTTTTSGISSIPSFEPPKLSASPKKAATPKAKGVTKKMAAKKATRKSPTKPRTGGPIPAPETYFSEHVTGAKGPDRSLYTGPNVDLLLTDYVQQTGSNPEYRKGPESENRQGPKEQTGRDIGLSTGPDSSNLMGAEPGLAKGSIYQGARQS